MTNRTDSEPDPALTEYVAEYWVNEMRSRLLIFLGLGLVTTGIAIYTASLSATQMSIGASILGGGFTVIAMTYSIRYRLRRDAVTEYSRRKELVEERPDLVDDAPDID